MSHLDKTCYLDIYDVSSHIIGLFSDSVYKTVLSSVDFYRILCTENIVCISIFPFFYFFRIKLVTMVRCSLLQVEL